MRTYKRVSNRCAYSEQSLKEALKLIGEGVPLKAAARRFGVPPKTLRRHKNNQVLEPGTTALGRKAVFSPSFEQQLTDHIQEMERALFGLSTRDVRRLAFDLAERLKIKHSFNTELKMAGKDWLYGFMRRQGTLSVHTPQPTSISRMVGFNRPKVNMFFDVYEGELKKFTQMDPTRIWNVDETGVQNVQKPHQIVATKGKRQVARVTSAERGFTITSVCAMSAAGQFVPPMFIFPRKRMNERLLYGAPTGSVGAVSDSGWIDSCLFVQWLGHFCNVVGSSTERPHILILDGHHSHKTLEAVLLARERGVIMITIPPHCSHKMQPLDRTFFRTLKSGYNTAADSWLTCHPGERIDSYAVCGLFNQAYGDAATVAKAEKGFLVSGLWPVNRLVFKDEDFEAAQVTEEPAPVMEEEEIEEEIIAGKRRKKWNKTNVQYTILLEID
ncbi:hypothetical protein ACEWY4_007605 [Coilia grayii]|uniref:DDE-1 domain-containing protein n=1 Tax=Coilia grayii TaxID=363190 RepID=A0ABD1KGX1_9TELE